jgi:hypothetical protein
MTQELRPLTLAELLDRTFSLYRQHILVFVGLIALPNLLMVGARIVNTAAAAGVGEDQVGRLLMSLATTFALALASMFTMAISQAATMVAVSRLHLNQPISIGGAFAGLKQRIFKLCVITIALVIQIAFCFLLCILPGIYVALRWSLALPVAVLEHAGLRQSMARSATLVEGQYGRVFMIYLLYALLFGSFQSAFFVPLFAIAVLTGGVAAGLPLWLQIGLEVGGFITQCLVGPLILIAISLVYYDSRVRKEGFDLEHMLAQLDPAAPPVVTTA